MMSLDISDFPTRHNYLLTLRQRHIERILADWVNELKVRRDQTFLRPIVCAAKRDLRHGVAQRASCGQRDTYRGGFLAISA